MRYIKQRILGVVLILGSIAMVYYSWYELREEGIYYPKMTAQPMPRPGQIF